MAVTTVERDDGGVCYRCGEPTGKPKGFLYCPECVEKMKKIVKDKELKNE